MNMKKIIVMIVLITMLAAAGFFLFAIMADTEEEKETASAPGSFKLSDISGFYIVSDESPDEDLLETVRTMDSLFSAAEIPSENALPIHYGEKEWAEAGDIVVILNPLYKSDLPNGKAQGFTIFPCSNGTLEISAGTTDGLWYGMNDLLQRCLEDDSAIENEVTDAPESPERTLLLDCGRKYYSRNWIENLIRRMSWQRYTSLHLHFSDAEGFGVESALYPWLNEGDYLSFDDLTSICETARMYHIEIIPELDSPGHLRYIIQKYAAHAAEEPGFSFTYQGQTYSATDEGGSNISNYYVYNGSRSAFSNSGIDLSNKTAVAFLNSLIDEYADYFAAQGSTHFCIGGDELFGWSGATAGGRSFSPNELWFAMEHWAAYAQDELGIENGSAGDTFVSYLNELSEHLGEKGFSCRVWNDQLLRIDNQHIALDPSIDIIYWSNDYTPMEKLASFGNKIHSSNTDWCYYVIRRDKRGGDIMDRTRRYCSGRYIYENWNPRNCATPKQDETLIPESSYAGGYFCIWSDSPDYKTAVTVWEDTEYRSWANAAKLWDHDVNKEMSYNEFKEHVKKTGTFPGFTGNCEAEYTLPRAGEEEQVRPGWREQLKHRLQKISG